MSRYFTPLVTFLFTFAPFAYASYDSTLSRRLGLGLVIGKPTGISGKYWLTSKTAADAALAWELGPHSSLTLLTTYLVHEKAIFLVDKQPFDLYYGIGVIMSSRESCKSDCLRMGPRAPLGLGYFFPKANIEVFSEISISLALIQSTEVDLGIGIGARYFF